MVDRLLFPFFEWRPQQLVICFWPGQLKLIPTSFPLYCVAKVLLNYSTMKTRKREWLDCLLCLAKEKKKDGGWACWCSFLFFAEHWAVPAP